MHSEPTGSPDASTSFERFRRQVLADDALQLELVGPHDDPGFLDLVLIRSRERGIDLDAEDLRQRLRPDPLGLHRWAPKPIERGAWPSPAWLPVHVGAADGAVHVDWAHFGDARLSDPFFEGSARQAQAKPFNRVFSRRILLDDLLAAPQADELAAPKGLIFHMSRCGSTLLAQMLAAAGSNVVVSESPVVDAAVRLGDVRALRVLLGLAGRARFDEDRDLFVKLDSWHVAALPLFRQAFPATPWIYLYRDPVEVLVSQVRERGMQTAPGALPYPVFGLDPAAMSDEDYCAAVLGRTCAAAVEHFGLGGGLLIDYRELPEAVFTRVLPHFGLALGEADRQAMAAVTLRDSKRPYVPFTPDSEAKSRAASGPLRERAGRHIDEPYRRLEALRMAAS